MSGMSRHTTEQLTGDAHLEQSIGDILSTPIGSRVLRRDYGSDLPLLIDAPVNPETMIDLFHATAVALDRWEPRFALRRVEIADASAGHVDLRLTGDVNSATTIINTGVGAAS